LKPPALGDSRVELSFASGNRVEIRNHSALPLPGALPKGVPAAVSQTPQPVGEWIGPDGAPHAMISHNIMTDAAWFFPALTLERLLTAQNYVLSYIGQETLNGSTVLHIAASQSIVISSASGGSASSGPPGSSPAQVQALLQYLSRMDLYFDPSSSLPVALAFDAHPDNNAGIEIRFSGYKPVSGIAIPMEVQKYMNYGLVLDLQFANATVNSGLSALAFAVQ
jgi:hypothetical protein